MRNQGPDDDTKGSRLLARSAGGPGNDRADLERAMLSEPLGRKEHLVELTDQKSVKRPLALEARILRQEEDQLSPGIVPMQCGHDFLESRNRSAVLPNLPDRVHEAVFATVEG